MTHSSHHYLAIDEAADLERNAIKEVESRVAELAKGVAKGQERMVKYVQELNLR